MDKEKLKINGVRVPELHWSNYNILVAYSQVNVTFFYYSFQV